MCLRTAWRGGEHTEVNGEGCAEYNLEKTA